MTLGREDFGRSLAGTHRRFVICGEDRLRASSAFSLFSFAVLLLTGPRDSACGSDLDQPLRLDVGNDLSLKKLKKARAFVPNSW